MLPTVGNAKSETARIVITAGSAQPLLTLSGPASAGQFTIWSGPGTSSGPRTSARDFADWGAGIVDKPADPDVYQVRFFCKTPQWQVPDRGAEFQCYGVRYAIDRRSGQGYVQIPPAHDAEFPRNTQSIYHGVEGSWYRATARWEELVRPAIERARIAAR